MQWLGVVEIDTVVVQASESPLTTGIEIYPLSASLMIGDYFIFLVTVSEDFVGLKLRYYVL